MYLYQEYVSQQVNSGVAVGQTSRRRVLQALGSVGVAGVVGTSQLVSAQSSIQFEGEALPGTILRIRLIQHSLSNLERM